MYERREHTIIISTKQQQHRYITPPFKSHRRIKTRHDVEKKEKTPQAAILLRAQDSNVAGRNSSYYYTSLQKLADPASTAMCTIVPC